ncbi:MAG: OmpA family protein [Flavobacterium sp.]
MKKLILLVLILFSILSWGQKKKISKADKLFNNHSYMEAANIYFTMEPTQNNLQNMGDCFYFNSQMYQASSAYEKLFSTTKDSIRPEYYFRYAQALLGTGNYKEADQYLSQYFKKTINTQEFKTGLYKITPHNYEVKSLSKTNNNGSFGLTIWGDKVVFSLPNNTGEKEKTYQWNQKPYLDLFEAKLDTTKGELKDIKAFPVEINTEKHESSATFSQDGKIMYFNRNNEKRIQIGDTKVATIKIYRAEFDGEKWINISQMPFSNDLYSTQHPMLSKDGKKLFFSSDQAGSLGSFDIYYVDILENGTYSAPVNLGETINTKEREQFPYIDEDNTLYFASDGHQGLGGLDVFMSRFTDGKYEKPINLGAVVNSGLDDFGLVLNGKNKGFLSSNRDGADNIYSFKREENKSRLIMEGEVRDINSKNALAGATVTFYDEPGKILSTMVVGEKGKYSFKTEPNKNYRVQAEKPFYIPFSKKFKTNQDGKADIQVELEIESYDDAEDIVITKPDGYVYIVLENIYFDFNKSNITAEAAKTLNILVNLLRKYPKMEVELGAHTDSRANPDFNLKLSNARAKATMDYLIKNGINAKRLRSKGYGESSPLIKCGNNCTETEHSINRRCEFIILK